MKRATFYILAILSLALPELIIGNSRIMHQDVSPNATLISANNQAISLSFEIANIDRQSINFNGESFDSLTIVGEGTTYEYGKPILPSVSRFVIVPPTAGLELVVSADDPERERIDNLPIICTEEGLGTTELGAGNGNSDIYPSVLAEMSEPFIIRGVRLVKITTYPVRFERSSNSYLHYSNIVTEIRLNDNQPINPVLQPTRRNRSKEFLQFIQALAINGDLVGRDDPDIDSEPLYTGHYLLAIHENCVEYVAPFIEWRRKAGYKVDILSIPNNISRTERDVKELIQERYDEYLDAGIDPFEYLLIVGDRSTYNGIAENGNWIIESYNGSTVWPHYARHADYLYGCLEGDDDYPDVAICRMPAGDANRLNIAVGRTLAYEAEPYMEDTDWFTRGGVFSQHWGNGANTAWHMTIHTNVRWGKEVLEYLNFEDVRFYEDYDWDQQGARVGPFERDLFNDGSNLHLGRAENYYWRGNFNNVNENVVFPIRLVISGHGEWAAENSFRTAPGNRSLKGQVAGTCGWGGPPTAPMSSVWMNLVSGHLLRDMPLGWARTYAVIDVERYFPNSQWMNQPLYRHVKSDVDAYGDPGIKYWRGVPQVVGADHDEVVPPGTRVIDVYVFDIDEEAAIENAQVTLYAAGDRPRFDDDNYADYDGYKMWTTTSDEDGFAQFVFEAGDLEEGTLNVTVTGREIRPYFSEIDVENVDAAIDVASYTLESLDGDDDIVRPGERFALSITAGNIGNGNAVNNVTGVVSSQSPYVTVEQNELSFGNISAGNQADADEEVIIHISETCPDGESRPITQPVLQIRFASEQRGWRSAIKLNPSAPNFSTQSVIGGNIVSTDRQDLDIRLQNIGSLDAPPVSAVLVSGGRGIISVVNRNGRYPAIASGRNSVLQGDSFEISGNRLAVPGSKEQMMLILTNEDGFIDTAYFELQLDEPRENAPQGPDGYGYFCFDDTDEAWDVAPVYDWFEISRDVRMRDANGTPCDFTGNPDHQSNAGESQVVDLGFSTQFYGEMYDQITICTNGFIAMGDQGEITNFQNWPMDRSMGGGLGMIAPLWDKLAFQDDSNVYYYHNEDEGWFVIEWYKLRHHQADNGDLTFQVILYDHDVWVTQTGDQAILIQYQSVTNDDGLNDRASDNPYASVGICSPDGTTGINYTWNNEYPVTSNRLGNRQAILFSSDLSLLTGYLHGRVTDAENNAPLEGVTVVTEHGLTAMTDEDGLWEIQEAIAEIEFDITASILGYNDSTLVDLLLEEDDSMEVNFSLLHPEFESSLDEHESFLLRGQSEEVGFDIRNDGNGKLEWSVELRLADEFNIAPWEERRRYAVSDEIEDPRVKGVVFVNDKFYVTGGGRSNRDDNFIYVLDREGNLEDRYAQLSNSWYGINDLAWDGELLWGGADNMIYGFTLDGEEAVSFETANGYDYAIAWDSDRDVLWISGKLTSDIYAYDRDGNLVDEIASPDDMMVYGLSYWTEDPDHPLYISNVLTIGEVDHPSIHKINPDNGESEFVTYLELEEGSTPEGAFITNTFDVYSWVLIGVENDASNDKLHIWQIDARKDWFDLNPNGSGVIDPGNNEDYTLTLNAEGLPVAEFNAFLDFSHNAAGGRTIIPITLDVQQGAGEPVSQVISFNEGWNMVSLHIAPQEPDITEIMRPLVENGLLRIMKDGLGRFYSPSDNFINIPEWTSENGYLINLSEATQLRVNGIMIAADDSIALNAGWNLKAYFPYEPIEATVALANIVDDLIIAKDGSGRFYLPQYNYSNIGEMLPGKGYHFKVSEDTDLIYNVGDVEEMVFNHIVSPKHFSILGHSGINMSMLAIANPSYSGYELGAFDASGQLVGSGRFGTDGRCGLALWGDDPPTGAVEGLTTNSTISFQLWDGNYERNVVLKSLVGEPVWNAIDIFVAEIQSDVDVPVSFGFQDSYPNPTNGPMRISFNLDQGGHTTLKLYNVAGREVGTLFEQDAQAGNHEVVWNTDGYPSGVYLVRLEGANRNSIRKLAVVK